MIGDRPPLEQIEAHMADLWYYTSEGQAREPVTGSELKQLAAAGQLKPTDLVWKEGMSQWVRASLAPGPFEEQDLRANRAPEAASAAPAYDEQALLAEEPRRRRREEYEYDDEEEEFDRPRRRSGG